MVIKSGKKQNIEELKQKLLPVLKQHQVSRAGIFGSSARGTERTSSDVDLLVEFKGKKNLLDLVALKLDLEETIDKNVDILTYQALNPLIKERVLKQEVRIL